MRHSVPHNLEPKKAKKMLGQLLDTYGAHYKDYDINADWRDDQTAKVDMNIQGRDVKGIIKIAPDSYDLDFDMPWFFLPFKPKIKKTVDEEVQRWLANF
jgi:hypothetical protein